jgi:threonine dehydrogenase-like Zn-dependent dehydrogenase
MENTTIFGLTVAEFEDISMKVLLSGLIAYMFFIIWNLAVESKAGKFGTVVMFLVLGLGMFGFMAKAIIARVLGLHLE